MAEGKPSHAVKIEAACLNGSAPPVSECLHEDRGKHGRKAGESRPGDAKSWKIVEAARGASEAL